MLNLTSIERLSIDVGLEIKKISPVKANAKMGGNKMSQEHA